MKVSGLGRYAFCVSIGVAMLAGCGGSQPPIGAPRAMPLSTDHTQKSPDRNAGRGKGRVEFTYVANVYSNNVSAYAISASNGALTQVQGSPFAAGYGPYGVAIDSRASSRTWQTMVRLLGTTRATFPPSPSIRAAVP